MISTFIQILDGYFFKTVEISLHASLIIGVLLIIRPLIKSFLPPRWVYALWFIVVARLLLIEVPTLPESASLPVQNALAVVQSLNEESSPVPRAVQASASSDIPGTCASTWPEVLAVVWLIGMASLLFHFGWVNFHWSRRLARAPEIMVPEICRLLEECRQETGVRSVRLVQLPGFASPSITGLFQPVIILPEDFLERFTPEELRWILLHELAHLKRWDLPVQVLCQVLQAIHWFNPFVWFAFACFRCDRELACDAHVLDREAARTSRDYGHTLIKVAEIYPRSLFSPGFLGITEEKTDLHERVEKISRHRRPALMWVASGAILCALLAAVFLTKATQQLPHQATAKIEIWNAGVSAEIEVIQSLGIVVPAICDLGLDKTWAKKAGSNESALTPGEIMDRVSKMLTVHQLPNLDIVYITVADDNPVEAADIANSIVKRYNAQRHDLALKDAIEMVYQNLGNQLADQESAVAASTLNLKKLQDDPSHPPDPVVLHAAQLKLDKDQALLVDIKTQMQQQTDKYLAQNTGVRILAPAY